MPIHKHIPSTKPKLPSAIKEVNHYDRQWRKIRLAYLQQNPWCVVCDYAATEVDHILPITKGGTDVVHNLQSLCKSCHSKKTYAETSRTN